MTTTRKEVIHYTHLLHQKGWVANHDGNVTARIEKNRYLATPTATSKADIKDFDLLVVDETGKKLQGRKNTFGELVCHLHVYAARDDVGAVFHAHPPYATAIACGPQNLIETPFIAEAVVSLGAKIPCLDYTSPGQETAQALARVSREVDAVLCQNHGVFTWGKDCEQAFLRMELVEHLASIATKARSLGGVIPLPSHAIAPLLAKRRKAGLGAAADNS